MSDRRRAYGVVLVASLPPPVAGQSMATVVLERALREQSVAHHVVNLSRQFYVEGRARKIAGRLAQMAALAPRAALAARRLPSPTLLYLQLGQSTQAMMRDVPVLAWAAAVGAPLVVHVHGGGFARALADAPAPLRATITRLVSRASAAIVLSPSLAPMFDGVVAADRVVCVDNAPTEEVTAFAAGLDRAAPAAGGLRVLYLSNLIESKGYVTVLEAARLARARGSTHRFVIAGAATELGDVDPAAYIAQHGLDNVEALGPVYGRDKLELLSRVDAFVLPTAYPTEGQPISILEAMQFGLPVITTRQGGIADVIADGDNGALIGPRDPGAILDALDGLAGDRWLAVSARNRELGMTRYCTERHVEAMLAVFDDAAAS